MDIHGFEEGGEGGHLIQGPAVRGGLPSVGVPAMPPDPAPLPDPLPDTIEGDPAGGRSMQVDPAAIERPQAEVSMPVHEPWRNQGLGVVESGHPAGDPTLEVGGSADQTDAAVLPPDGIGLRAVALGQEAPCAEQACVWKTGGRHNPRYLRAGGLTT
jgi:hypothetical protein